MHECFLRPVRDDRNLSIHVGRYNMRIGSDIGHDVWRLARYTLARMSFPPSTTLPSTALSLSFPVSAFAVRLVPFAWSSSFPPRNFVLRILMLAETWAPLAVQRETCINTCARARGPPQKNVPEADLSRGPSTSSISRHSDGSLDIVWWIEGIETLQLSLRFRGAIDDSGMVVEVGWPGTCCGFTSKWLGAKLEPWTILATEIKLGIKTTKQTAFTPSAFCPSFVDSFSEDYTRVVYVCVQ